MVATPRIALLVGICLVILLVQPGSTDDFIMKDGTVIEGIIKNYDARSKEILIQIDEKGKTRRVKERDIKYRVKKKTTWQRRASGLEWYEKNEPRRKDTWKDREFFGSMCRRKYVPDKAKIQFALAYKFRVKDFKAKRAEGKWRARRR